jgi:hypothetical protein
VCLGSTGRKACTGDMAVYTPLLEEYKRGETRHDLGHSQPNMFSYLALFTLYVSYACAAPLEMAKRQNQPSFGGWDQGQNVTELIQELYQQVNPIDRDVLLPQDGFVFDFLSESRALTNLQADLQRRRALAEAARTAA